MRFFGPFLRLAGLGAGLLAFSCAAGPATYLDRVRPQSVDQAHPLLAELLPLLAQPEGRSPDDLARAWKEFTAGEEWPLRQEKQSTFVFYDFTGTKTQVFLEASFAPNRPEPLTRIGTSRLFVRVYEIPRTDKLRYRFTDGNTALPDPFRADVEPGADQWHAPFDPALPSVERIVGASETLLQGQDVTVVLPPGYRRNLAWTYPLLVVVGQSGDGWTAALVNQMRTRSMAPVVAVGLPEPAAGWTAAELKPLLEDRLVPWMRGRYRVSPLPADLTLTGWDRAAPAVKELATGRPDFWNKTWHTDLDWSATAPLYLRTQYPVVNP